MPAPRVYMRTSVTGWPIERQETLLRERVEGIKDWLNGPIYRDLVSAPTLKTKGRDALTERAMLLRPTSRRTSETIYVAHIGCFALNIVDLTAAIAEAHVRNATIVSVSDDLVIPPGAEPAIIAAATAAFDKTRRRAQTEPGREKGYQVSAERRRKLTASAIEQVRADWRRPTSEISTDEISEKSGLSIKTLYSKLGRRSEAQKNAQRQAKRKAAKR